jgi:hypothetical protein
VDIARRASSMSVVLKDTIWRGRNTYNGTRRGKNTNHPISIKRFRLL